MEKNKGSVDNFIGVVISVYGVEVAAGYVKDMRSCFKDGLLTYYVKKLKEGYNEAFILADIRNLSVRSVSPKEFTNSQEELAMKLETLEWRRNLVAQEMDTRNKQEELASKLPGIVPESNILNP